MSVQVHTYNPNSDTQYGPFQAEDIDDAETRINLMIGDFLEAGFTVIGDHHLGWYVSHECDAPTHIGHDGPHTTELVITIER